MPRLYSRVLSAVAWPGRTIRRRPVTAAGLTLLAVVVVLAAGYWYAVRQWSAAQADLAAGRVVEAHDRLGLCLRVWPRSYDVHLLAARTARLTGDLKAAEDHLKTCLRLRGGATNRVQLEFLLLRVQAGDEDEVTDPLFDLVERGDPQAPVILETLARRYIERFRYAYAQACLNKWIELDPDSAKAHHLRGWVRERLDRPEGAAADYRRVLEIDPDHLLVRLRVADMLLEDKQAPEALPHLERLYRQAPDKPEVLVRLGICRFMHGQTEEARRLLEAAEARTPNDPILLVHLAKLDLQEGRAADAERRLRTAIRSDSSDTEARYNLVSALRVLGRDRDAEEALKEYERFKATVDRANHLLREVVDRPNARTADYAELGSLLIQVKQERGLYWLYEALQRDPGHEPAHLALAEYYEQKGDAVKAADHRRMIRPPPAPGK